MLAHAIWQSGIQYCWRLAGLLTAAPICSLQSLSLQAPFTADSRPTAFHASASLGALPKLRLLELAGLLHVRYWPARSLARKACANH